MNKFDDMMYFLSFLRPHFSQVIAVDRDFALFHRAWCVAELYVAHALRMRQSMQVMSKSNFAEHHEELQQLRVEDMSSSNPADKEMILNKIQDKDAFNARLMSMIFDDDGLLQTWKDGFDIVAFLADIARRGRDRVEPANLV